MVQRQFLVVVVSAAAGMVTTGGAAGEGARECVPRRHAMRPWMRVSAVVAVYARTDWDGIRH